MTSSDRTPVFFISYAHRPQRARPTRDAHLVRDFYDTLYGHVDELLGLQAGQEAGFMDAEMDGGQRWSDDLAYAIGHCQVLVPLISPRFAGSEWCAREWHAFTRRPHRTFPTATSSHGATPIIPVSWTPFPIEQLPGEIRAVQLFTPALPQPEMARLYQSEGLYGLLQLGERGLEVYEAVVWKLAQWIADAFWTHDVETDKDVDFRGLATEFGEDPT
ncbi:TIR-like protein FxsC [Actinoplanes awajinensis]|uniref:TIR-like protein FxsC n=1 Tax=Actinoplanes awajinensis TaxID=135946 RepID=UPI000AF47919|nr:TIR-like protein FxsC [Actinoplanes awajinensis]